MTPEEKLAQARSRLLAVLPFYGHVALQLRFLPSELPWLPGPARTMGVRVLADGSVECLYSPPFVLRLPTAELAAVLQHEVEHVLRLHCLRRGLRDPGLFNLAADMVVNGARDRPRIGLPCGPDGSLALPLGGRLVWIPPGWPSYLTAEAYCERLAALGGPGRAALGLVPAALADDHTVWEQSTATEEEARPAVWRLAHGAAGRSRGAVPGHLAAAIEALRPPEVPWESLLRRHLARNEVGGRRRSWNRADRRRPGFGRPGTARRAAATVNVVVDTSGSVPADLLERFFGEIERLSRHARVFLLQWDQICQGYGPYRSGDWRSLRVRGRGGTDLAAAFAWLDAHGRRAGVRVLLTDGLTTWPEPNPGADPGGWRLVTAIAGDPARIAPPRWGDVVFLGDNFR